VVNLRVDGVVMKNRIISAIIMIMLFVPIAIIGGYPFLILFSILGLLGLKELIDLEKNIPLVIKISAYIFSLFFILFNYSTKMLNFSFNVEFFLAICLFYFCAVVIIGDLKKYNYKDAIYLIIGVLFIGMMFKGFIVVRNIGLYEIFYLFLISSLTDTFALFCGKYFGKNKLSVISPNKTIEGSIGGSLFGSVFSSLIYLALTGFDSNVFVVLGVTLILSILGQIGDLFFSSIKRMYGIKDFSNLIPGHGGILDRLDSVLFVLLGYIIILM